MTDTSPDKAYRCSFCGKTGEQVEHLIRGPGRVIICNVCVGWCNAILAERRAGRRLRKRRRRPSGSLRRRRATVVVGSDEAVARVRDEFEAIANLGCLRLHHLNRSPDPAEHYHSMHEYVRELWARAHAVSSFAVSTGLISSTQALEIIQDFLAAHPEADSTG
jgi:ClpX C4-type zinc finger protein